MSFDEMAFDDVFLDDTVIPKYQTWAHKGVYRRKWSRRIDLIIEKDVIEQSIVETRVSSKIDRRNV